MEEVTTPQLPTINGHFCLGGIPAERESPERSWNRIRTCLIDNPKDEGLQRRQETWTYHQKNRGVLKSLMKTLPNVPYRVRKDTKESFNGNNDRRRRVINNKVRLPRVNKDENMLRQPQERLLGDLNYGESPEELDEKVRQRLDYRYESPDDSPVFNVENGSKVTRLPKIGDSPLQIAYERHRHNRNKLARSKNVSFSLNDLPSINRRVQREPSSSSSSSGSSAISDGILEGYGPSSNILPDMPYSVLDVLSGNHLSNSRTLGPSHRQKYRDWERTRTPKKKIAKIPESETDRQWLKKVVGDKEVINLTSYDSYARTKPISDQYTSVPYPPKRLPEKLANRRSNDHKSTSHPPNRTNGNGPVARGNINVFQKTSPLGNISKPPPVGKLPPANLSKSPVGSTKSSPIGQNIASKSPVGHGQQYFPVFTGDGGPVRKIGGQRKKLKGMIPHPNEPSPYRSEFSPFGSNMNPETVMFSPREYDEGLYSYRNTPSVGHSSSETSSKNTTMIKASPTFEKDTKGDKSKVRNMMLTKTNSTTSYL